jgi:hypothetical protein
MFLFVGLVFILIGVYYIIKTHQYKTKGIKAAATVKEVVSQRSTEVSSNSFKKEIMYYPVLTFISKDGKSITKQSNSGRNTQSAYKVGDQVKIYYKAEKPEDFILDNFFTTMLLPYGCLLVGGIVFIVGCF